MSDDHESLLFRAHSVRVGLSLEGQAIGIEAMNANGISLVLELSGGGPAALKAELERLFREHPEIGSWRSPPRN